MTINIPDDLGARILAAATYQKMTPATAVAEAFLEWLEGEDGGEEPPPPETAEARAARYAAMTPEQRMIQESIDASGARLQKMIALELSKPSPFVTMFDREVRVNHRDGTHEVLHTHPLKIVVGKRN